MTAFPHRGGGEQPGDKTMTAFPHRGGGGGGQPGDKTMTAFPHSLFGIKSPHTAWTMQFARLSPALLLSWEGGGQCLTGAINSFIVCMKKC